MGKLNSFSLRCISSLLLLVTTIVTFYLGGCYFKAFILLIGFFIAYEWSSAIPKKNKLLYLVIYLISIGFISFLPYPFGIGAVLASSVIAYFVARKEKFRKLSALGAIYIPLGIGALYHTYVATEAGDLDMFLYLILTVWGMDVGGYIVGCSLKGPKLLPKISPNKTWSGFIGGILFACIFLFAFEYIDIKYLRISNSYKYLYLNESNIFGLYPLGLVFIGVVFAIISQVGDLIQSAIKRHVKIKDFSNLIPGHGGFFDRFDALIFAAMFYYVISIL